MSDLKRKNFLNLLNNDHTIIKPSHTKGGLWIKQFGFSNLLCIWATWAITNHALIGEYWLRFFPREEFSCPYRFYPIKSRCHILYNCRRLNKYWNPKRNTIGQFISFLEFNLNEHVYQSWKQWILFIFISFSHFHVFFQFIFQFSIFRT